MDTISRSGGVQEHSKGELYPWIISVKGSISHDTLVIYAHHPDGRRSPDFKVHTDAEFKPTHRKVQQWVRDFGNDSRYNYGEE